ncbi:LysR substrate-binding domain-containing protein [Sinirhodobacter sp. WL0062]|uniref:LysR substrate-binding domain-containing protein n=1 Tax=Rhodobacter flavimaris TaxID=2907145 RepID=A0ABS8YTB1_9RHOB|nr:LysR substrate-binding domain-containing protein [Sinirhodobacter sp. WL0062]MCE5973102.1 LysR substrate-binding domain-containing protein [Sinirhodobacter sp. WL0062]
MHQLTAHQFIRVIMKAGSIRKAAEELAITSTALNRRVLALEEELGVPIFERLPRGVRLSTAGELLLGYLSNQAADLERLKSQLADLSGERRGHVSIACSQALIPFFMPEQIGRYRREHPGVTFAVRLRDRAAAEAALVEHAADIALIFEPIRLSEVQILSSVRQRIHAVMSTDHPLAAEKVVRLRDCGAYPIGLPTASYGVRHLIDVALVQSSVRLRMVLESDNFDFLRRYPSQEQLISFQIPIGLPDSDHAEGVTSRPVDARDIPDGRLYLCQLRGRTLPVAAAKFAALLEGVLETRYGADA